MVHDQVSNSAFAFLFKNPLFIEINFWSFEIEIIHNLSLSFCLFPLTLFVDIWQACLFIFSFLSALYFFSFQTRFEPTFFSGAMYLSVFAE